MTEMIKRARLAVVEVIQNSDLPAGTYIDSEKIVRAVLEAMRDFKTEDYTLSEASAIRRLIDEALEG
jgi:galactokinase/mevalonate kinase-like predicted kinase